MEGCLDCGKEQGTLNEYLQTEIANAQKLANTENKAVAVFAVDGKRFSHAVIEGGLPPLTVKTVKPL